MSCWMMLNVTRVGKIKSSSFAGLTWDMTNSVHSCSWKLQVQDINWLYYCVIIMNYITIDDQNTIRQYQWIGIVCWVVSARDFLQKFQSCRFIRIEVQTIFWNMKLLSVVVIIVVGETRKKIEKKPRHQDFVTSNMSKVGKWIFFFIIFYRRHETCRVSVECLTRENDSRCLMSKLWIYEVFKFSTIDLADGARLDVSVHLSMRHSTPLQWTLIFELLFHSIFFCLVIENCVKLKTNRSSDSFKLLRYANILKSSTLGFVTPSQWCGGKKTQKYF